MSHSSVLEPPRKVDSLLNAAMVLRLYREQCAARGLSCDKIIVD